MPPELPPEGRHLWSAFCALDTARPEGFNGPAAISYGEIQAYIKTTHDHLSPWEVRAIRVLDMARRGQIKGAPGNEQGNNAT